MPAFLTPLMLFLLSPPALAAVKDVEGAAESPPPETVDIIWVILFMVVFVGMIVGFFVYLWYRERQRKAAEEGKD